MQYFDVKWSFEKAQKEFWEYSKRFHSDSNSSEKDYDKFIVMKKEYEDYQVIKKYLDEIKSRGGLNDNINAPQILNNNFATTFQRFLNFANNAYQAFEQNKPLIQEGLKTIQMLVKERESSRKSKK